MPEPIVAPAAEAPAEEALPVGDAPFKSTEEATAEPEGETAEISEEAQEIAKTIEPGEEKDAEEGLSEVDKILKDSETEETPNVQKRIDRLTAELKSLKEENAKYKEQKPAAEEKKSYTEDQLAFAMMKAVEENNPTLMRDVIKEIRGGVKEELIKMYNEEKQAGQKQYEQVESEWKETVDAYSKYADTKVPAIWPTSHKDLNLRDGTSLLYQVAMQLYTSNPIYKQPGGQKMAVADALTAVMRSKAGKGSNSKVKKLEGQLTKERMKRSPVSGVPGGGESKARTAPKTAQEDLDEYIAERKQYQSERGN